MKKVSHAAKEISPLFPIWHGAGAGKKHSPTMQASRTGSESLEIKVALQSIRDRLQGGG